MTSESRDVYQTLSFGTEGYYVRKAPIGIGVGLLGLVMLYLVYDHPDARAKDYAAAYMLIVAGFGFAAYTFWRRQYPGEPMLTLSPTGIRYRIDSRLTLVVPWNEIESVSTADIKIGSRGLSWTQRDVPVVLVSERLYRARVKPDSWWHHGLAWQQYFKPKDGKVQIAFYHDLLSVPAPELLDAIERRWRAFSRHPNAEKPSSPRPATPARPKVWAVAPWQKLAAAVALVVLVLPLVWYWRWGYAWLRFDVPEGSAGAYLDQLLDQQSVPARRADGRMVTLRRFDVSNVGAAKCHKDIARDPNANTLTPAYTVSAHCVADLTLRSGASAVAIFKLVESTYDVEYELGKVSKASVIVPAPLALDEAERRLCALRVC